MPGVLNSNSQLGFSREFGKMASIEATLTSMDCEDLRLEDIANKLFFNSPPLELIDSDGELSDDEAPMDLLKFLETDNGLDLEPFACGGDCNAKVEIDRIDAYNKYRVSSDQDPFMGTANQESSSPTAKNSLLSQMMSPLDYDHDLYLQQQKQQTQSFVAWEHKNLSIKEERDDYLDEFELIKSSFSHPVSSTYTEDEEVENTLPISFLNTPSPSSQSGTATGDDSDVDIETIADAPRNADSCGYITQESSPSSRASSPVLGVRGLDNGNLLSILTKSSGKTPASPSSSSVCSSASSSPRPIPHFNTYGVSSSKSLAENLMKGRASLLGHKRKSKEKRPHHSHNHHNQLEQRTSSLPQQQTHTHTLSTSNSINFHDYAMSPLSPESSPSVLPSTGSSTETGRPTVPQSKRIYKRKHLPLDASDKVKQHHHNQLERNRRQKLADLFIDLRDEVPRISCQSKASKVMILNEATSYIHELQRLEESQEKDIACELGRKDILLRQLRHFKSQLGGIHVG
ncbi:N-myc proto-oncogene protein [Plakobranchus ocellatus]|uniref:N-myc proto-oncogene protein n=1 Tax=Plakobranchus ocellatus TaxID=259542 RepID=A0AAV4DUH6_9GAST|nr:N-myc proto-oncogene protein [Plakobranchus ocellatus]